MNKYKTCRFGIILCLFLFFKSSLAENLEIAASGFLEWNQENNSYIADGNAIASQGARSIKADKITAFYESEENRDIVRIEAEGAVKFADTGNSGYSETLSYEMDAKLFVLLLVATPAVTANYETLLVTALFDRPISAGSDGKYCNISPKGHNRSMCSV